MPIYRVTDAAGVLSRKIMCPADEIDRQLAPGETAAEVDPLVDGLGMTTELLAAVDQYEADLRTTSPETDHE